MIKLLISKLHTQHSILTTFPTPLPPCSRAPLLLVDLGGLLMDLQNLLGCRVDVVTGKGLRTRIRERVLKEAKSL